MRANTHHLAGILNAAKARGEPHYRIAARAGLKPVAVHRVAVRGRDLTLTNAIKLYEAMGTPLVAVPEKLVATVERFIRMKDRQPHYRELRADGR
jgi:hypothetical protein